MLFYNIKIVFIFIGKYAITYIREWMGKILKIKKKLLKNDIRKGRIRWNTKIS